MTERVGIRRRLTVEDVLVDTFVYLGVALAFVVTLYPFVFVLSMSISDPVAVARREIFLLPKGFSLDAYRTVLNDPTVIRSYYNTIWYTGVGTTLNLVFTVMAAYPLSKRNFSARGVLMFLFVFTMFFSGGLIPLFVLVVKLGLYATRWAIVIPTLIATFNLIICRTFFQTLPEDLFECARIEGRGRVADRLEDRGAAVQADHPRPSWCCSTGSNHWNSFFPALLYLPKAELQPIQIYLRRVLIQASPEAVQQFETGESGQRASWRWCRSSSR